MAAERPFPPSARRRALAGRSGLHAASPVLVGGAACGVAVLAVIALARTAADRLADSIAAAARGDAAALAPSQIIDAVLALALPVVGAAAIAAIAAHVAQTRALWLPRRRLRDAPAVAAGPPARVRRAAFELAAGTVIGAVALGWLWLVAPRLAALPTMPRAAAALIASALAAFAIAWLAIGVLDGLLRHAAVATALRMTPREKREDDRLAGADPRWREHRARSGREIPRDAVAGATVLLLGDDVAVAIAWDPVRRPIPLRTATGRGPRATQLLGLARRHRIPVHRDAALASALVATGGPVPELHWSRLAEIVAALRR